MDIFDATVSWCRPARGLRPRVDIFFHPAKLSCGKLVPHDSAEGEKKTMYIKIMMSEHNFVDTLSNYLNHPTRQCNQTELVFLLLHRLELLHTHSVLRQSNHFQ